MYDSIDVTTENVTSENYQMSWFNRCVNDKKNWIQTEYVNVTELSNVMSKYYMMMLASKNIGSEPERRNDSAEKDIQ